MTSGTQAWSYAKGPDICAAEDLAGLKRVVLGVYLTWIWREAGEGGGRPKALQFHVAHCVFSITG